MRQRLALLPLGAWPLLLSLAGCGAVPDDPRAAQCRQQAFDDPTVQEAIMRANSPLQEVRVPGVRDQKRAIERFVARCLAGPNQRGGVQPVQRQQ